ncbi:MAG: hypothetical protein DMF94_03645 [Acidobacteria bacterium]|nr:MAG: hypothetical protein DMF96_19425 [Acidobacteriota bacterium]PYR22723.1 MAG: hypothetical protein DMF94_03645 [Acidobacteriota bacterium]
MRPCFTRSRLRAGGRGVLVRVNTQPAQAFAYVVGHLYQATIDEELALMSMHDTPDQMWMTKQAH